MDAVDIKAVRYDQLGMVGSIKWGVMEFCCDIEVRIN